MIVRDQDLFDAGSKQLEEMQRLTAAVGLGHFLGAGLPFSSRQFILIALHRPLDDNHDFSDEHKAMMTDLMPHLRQAIYLAEKFSTLRRHVADIEAATNKLRCGILICDAEAHVIWRNHTAGMLLSVPTGLRMSSGRLAAASPSETQELRQAIASIAKIDREAVGPDPATASAAPVVLHGQAGTDAPLHVLALPLEQGAIDDRAFAQASGRTGRALLLVSNLAVSKMLRSDLVARLFSLTATEANLALELCRGRTVAEYAMSHRVSVGTARFQLKRILAKTQTARQSDVVRAVCSSIASQISEFAGEPRDYVVRQPSRH
ncbi:MAG: helix-turn-helix transcriptional regulator [Alphaproteobacteria bacterium]|nr:helix-turn-helix transcriptional regulator [Alphaproteobacteria bacterium]MDE2073523.1 helix-turn-helix transcriptional regulator [Alphaproteobacteria bacterium]MDE2352029.1 helix-turn-helix transcriptional regulator [Alphaproteobacteria bacterium]